MTVAGQRYEVGSTKGIRDMLWSGTAGLGLHIPLSPLWDLKLRPGMRYALTPLNDSPAYPFQPFSLSLSTGLGYRFPSKP